jgi:anaerobic magnesium-protoporphyrin IX monomethyl ester cyclase
VIPGYAEEKLLAYITGKIVHGNVRIDDLPFPDRDCLPIHDYKQWIEGRKATVIMASRGCPYNCSFCSKINRRFEAQSAKRTLEEIYFVNDRYGYTAFTIYDDAFAIVLKRLVEMVSVLETEDFKFRCFCRADLLTEDVCHLLARMGVVAVGVGIEAGE